MANEKDNIQEPEEQAGAVPPAQAVDEEMLTEEQPIDRTHASVHATGETVNEWKPPPYQPGAGEDIGAGESAAGQQQQQEEFVNPDLMDLPEGDKIEGATYMADMAIEIYGEGKKELGNLLLPIKQRRLKKLEEKGLIDQDIMLPTRGGGYAPASAFIESYNQKATDVFGVRPKFREEVRPILIKEFAKKGIGLTPWQRIAFAVFIDLKEDVKIAMGLRAAADEIVEAMKDMTAAVKEHGYVNTAPVAQPPAAEQPVNNNQQQNVQQPVFDPSNPGAAFDHIQGSRPGTVQSAPAPTMTQQPPASVTILKTVRKRKPYKKRSKVKPPVTIHVTPNKD